MEQIINKILNEYISAKQEPFAENPIGSFFRKDIPRKIYNTGIVDPNGYLITGSVGQGNWANVPWVCIFDRRVTTSVTKGVYIVYLLAKDGQTLYLTLNQGCTEIRNSHNKRDTIKIMREKASHIVSCINDRGFMSDENINLGDGLTELAELYQKGTIFYTSYKKGSVPSEEILQKDISNMMDIYSEYVANIEPMTVPIAYAAHAVGSFDSWEIINDYTAIKTCDKSFFEHNGSGVPKEICWFFDAEEIPQGENCKVTLSYNGKDFTGKISNDTTDRIRTRISWNADLGNIFKRLRNNKTQRLLFEKSGERYLISFEGDEQKVTVKESVEKIKEYIAAAGFTYPGDLIENFWLCLKSKPFVILAGTSGTGKTRLVRLFAEAISAEYKLISVRPDWSDSSDLFGHTDLSGNFHEEIALTFIKEAIQNPTKPYFLCLDEMNLARVEYYLSDILSKIETRELKPNGEIRSDNFDSRDDEICNVYLPQNLYIVGTVNMDETTFPFSKKVLDRANTIEFSYVNMIPDFDSFSGNSEKQVLTNDFLKTDYLIMKDCQSKKDFIVSACAQLDEINKILKKAEAHVGYRVRDEICFYLINNKHEGLISEDAAFDNEIMQKILPRIQGSSAQIKGVLCDLFRFCAGDYRNNSGTDADNMQAYLNGKAVQYPKSAEKIVLMVRRYDEDGFTSYWL